jgi:prepilin-type N-terminal cleavage/methylation domain-containing protein/prepilin-type processing-associated H-X9-DG protein
MRVERRRNGFTLVELLVVIAIIGILVALLLPAINAARESGRRTACSNNLRQTGLAFIAYAEANGVYPPPYREDPDTGTFIHILPFCEFNSIYEQYNLNEPWYSAANARAVQTNIPMLVCPSAPAGRDYISDYAADCEISGDVYDPLVQNKKIEPRSEYLGSLAPIDTGVSSPQKVTDGLSHTLMLFEDGGRPMTYVGGVLNPGTSSGAQWADKDNYFYTNSMICGDGDQVVNCMNDNEIYSFHPNGCNYLYCDGAVRFSRETMNIDTLVSLLTRAAGDNVNGTDSPFD